MVFLPFSPEPTLLPPPKATYDPQDQAQFRASVERSLRQLGAVSNALTVPWVDATSAPYRAQFDGVNDDSAAIQGAIDAVAAVVPTTTGETSGGGYVLLPEGTTIVDTITLRYGVRLIGMGQQATKIQAKAGSTAKAVIQLDSGIVAYAELRDFSLLGNGNTGQHGIYLHANPVKQDGITQGGLWYSRFSHVHVEGFDGEQIWLHGGDDSLVGPHQFLSFQHVEAITDSLLHRALRLSGQVGQVGFDDGCQFDGRGSGSGRLNGTENVLIERTVDPVTFANNGDIAPYSITFRGATLQSNNRAVRIERGFQIAFLNAHFEELKEGVLATTSSNTTILRDCYAANAGYVLAWSASTAYGVGDHAKSGGVTYRCILAHTNHVPPNVTYWVVESAGATGFFAKVSGGDASVMYADGCEFRGSTDTHFVREFTSQIRLGRNYHENDVIRTIGVTVAAIAPAATLDLKGAQTVFVNGGSTVVKTITSELAPDAKLTLRANGGDFYLGTGGNIDLGGFRTPLSVMQDASVTLVRNDLSGVWLVTDVGGPSSVRPAPVFITTTGTVNVAGGSELCDATGGAITRTLPNPPSVSAGARITIKKYDGSANSVTVAGNPDGITVTLAAGNDFVEVEWNGTDYKIVGIGNGSSSPPSATKISVADSKAVSAGVRASIADSDALSASARAGVADSKAVSAGSLASTAEGDALSASAAASACDSRLSSAGF